LNQCPFCATICKSIWPFMLSAGRFSIRQSRQPGIRRTMSKKSKAKNAKPQAVTVDLTEQQVSWKEVGIFLALTFALTYLLDLLFLYLAGGDNAALNLTSLHLQGRMLIPASCAIALGLFFFKDSPIYFRTFREQPRYFLYFYLVYTLLFLGLGISTVFIAGEKFFTISAGIVYGATLIGLILALLLPFSAGEKSYQKEGLALGKFEYYILFGLLFAALQGTMVWLNYLFGLGEAVELANMSFLQLLARGLREAVLLFSILGMMRTFGEEYGWRGYLQGELLRLGLVKGLSLVGLVWGLWQVPLVLMGYKYPGHPLSGVLAVIIYCLALSFILGLIKLKIGSIWLVAFIYSINDQTWSYLNAMVYRPKDSIFSFGPGIYGLIVWALVAGLFLLYYSERGGERTQGDKASQARS
jgi:membrane protease YdiL (CAAX protease family)